MADSDAFSVFLPSFLPLPCFQPASLPPPPVLRSLTFTSFPHTLSYIQLFFGFIASTDVTFASTLPSLILTLIFCPARISDASVKIRPLLSNTAPYPLDSTESGLSAVNFPAYSEILPHRSFNAYPIAAFRERSPEFTTASFSSIMSRGDLITFFPEISVNLPLSKDNLFPIAFSALCPKEFILTVISEICGVTATAAPVGVAARTEHTKSQIVKSVS